MSFHDFFKKFFKNKGATLGLFIVFFFILIAVLAPFISPYKPSEIFSDYARTPPIWAENSNSNFLLGTDDLGRDLLSRLIHGSQISLFVGLAVVVFSLSIGTLLGMLSGYFQGWVDRVIMRIVEWLMSLPSILLAIVVVSILGPGLMNAIIAVAIVEIPKFVRIIRGSVMQEKNKIYVMASENFGASHLHILIKNIFPNILAPIIVAGTLGFSDAILAIAALGFLGLGAQAPMAEWGTMLADSRSYIESLPWLVTLPGLCILLVVISFNLLGDGLRDALDPKL